MMMIGEGAELLETIFLDAVGFASNFLFTICFTEFLLLFRVHVKSTVIWVKFLAKHTGFLLMFCFNKFHDLVCSMQCCLSLPITMLFFGISQIMVQLKRQTFGLKNCFH